MVKTFNSVVIRKKMSLDVFPSASLEKNKRYDGTECVLTPSWIQTTDPDSDLSPCELIVRYSFGLRGALWGSRHRAYFNYKI